ncbi:MAG: hypothetical protein HY951_04545 [Bacteroidia bacterium]|nr:hypothetical protein [Bacteroidia bacterium]
MVRITSLGLADTTKTIDDYKKIADTENSSGLCVWDLMPEVAKEEKKFLIFCGDIPSSQTKIIITRQIPAEAKIRLINPKLDKLQQATEDIVKKLTKSILTEAPLKVVNNEVEILEHKETYQIIEGRVINSAFKEAIKENGKHFYISETALAILILTGIWLLIMSRQGYNSFPVLFPLIERIFTVAMTTFIVSGFDFWHTYKNISQAKTIAWTVSTERQKKK